MSDRKFEARPAVREQVPLLTGLVGPSGSGKTYSALRLATGIQQVVGGDIYGLDTEARRMAHYADFFKFQHVPFAEPFGSLDYLDALKYCVGKGAKVIIVDSMSHEHEGTGGMIDYQASEQQRMGGGDNVKMLAWVKPKQARRALINGILQLPCNFIFCFRAKHVSKPTKVNGKTEVIDQGFVPVSGDEFTYEQTVNIFLMPKSGGVPTWQSQRPGEAMAMKLPQQFVSIFAKQQPLSEDIGRQLAEWARGGAAAKPESPLIAVGRAVALQGSHALEKWWTKTLTKAQREALGAAFLAELKAAAAKADEPPEPPQRQPGDDAHEPAHDQDNERSGMFHDPDAAEPPALAERR